MYIFVIKRFIILALLCTVSFAASVDMTEKKSLTNAQKLIARKLNSFYKPSVSGTIRERISKGPEGFQWFEMGFYCK